MKLSVLMENTPLAPGFAAEPGLSLHLEGGGHSILFDAGKSSRFLENARKLGIELTRTELAILSHGHYDHSGGFLAFLKLNHNAPLYLHKLSAQKHYSRRAGGEVAEIGIDPELARHPRLVWTQGDTLLCPELMLFSSVRGTKACSLSNQTLLIQEEGEFKPDPFLHEQNLIIRQGDRTLLIAGCAHRGIINILERAVELTGKVPEVVVGGFHLSSPTLGKTEPEETVREVARGLLSFPQTRYYTCHCTGQAASEKLRSLMGERICLLQAGTQIEI